jgi:biotin carboxylase
MKRVLLLTTATGYQTRSFGEAARALGVDLVFGLDRCRGLEDPWGDRSLVVRYYEDDRSVDAIVAAAAEGPIAGVIALGDRPTVLAARAAESLGLRFHPPDAARASRNKLESRRRLAAAGLPVPAFQPFEASADPETFVAGVRFPCVVKPLVLSGSRGVIRADDRDEFVRAFVRVRHILDAPDVRTMKDPARQTILVEDYIPGAEFALEGLMEGGVLHTLAVFEKPDPLTGPFFEETTYVTPPRVSDDARDDIVAGVAAAAAALGLRHGPIHAECRVNADGVFVLEAAARPIGGLCARALRFTRDGGDAIAFEELLLRFAMGEPASAWAREACASGVMMIPIPRAGVFRGVDGVDEARSVAGVGEVLMTAVPDQHLVPLPEGASYLGFIFARAATSQDVIGALGAAHAALRFQIDRALPIAGGYFRFGGV